MSKNGGDSDDFVAALRDIMRSWRWPEPRIEQNLPKVIEICVKVGILVPRGDGFIVTELSQDDDAWERVWELFETEGIGEGSAS